MTLAPNRPASRVGQRRGMTEQAADATVDQACRSLRLPTMRARFVEVADAAEREQLTYRGFLTELLMATTRGEPGARKPARRVRAGGLGKRTGE